MDRRTFVKGAGTLAAGTAIAGCLGGGNNNGGQGTENGQGGTQGANQGNVSGQGDIGEFFDLDGNIVQNSDPNLKFLSTRLVRTGGSSLGSGGNSDLIPWFGGNQGGAGVIGRLRNTADRPMTSAEVSATLYDSNDNVLGTFFNNTEEAGVQFLRPNQTWTFRIWFENVNLNNAARYTVSADGQLADNSNLLGSGQGNFLFNGNLVNIGSNGEITNQNGQVVGNVTILQNNQNQGQGFQNVRVLPNGQVVDQNGTVVGRININLGDNSGTAGNSSANATGNGSANATGNNTTS